MSLKAEDNLCMICGARTVSRTFAYQRNLLSHTTHVSTLLGILRFLQPSDVHIKLKQLK